MDLAGILTQSLVAITVPVWAVSGAALGSCVPVNGISFSPAVVNKQSKDKLGEFS